VNCSFGLNFVKLLILFFLFSAITIPFLKGTGRCAAVDGLIKEIRVNGAFPLFEREILKVMNIFIGNSFSQEELLKQEKPIKLLFLKEGFIDPQIRLSADPDPQDGNYIVNVTIEKGAYYRLETVRLEGNDAFFDQTLNLRLKTWQKTFMFGQARRFIESEVREDVKNLIEYYRQHDYADVKISYTLEKDAQAKSVVVIIAIQEGRRYKIEFEGNKAFWDLTLKKDLVLSEQGNQGEIGIKDSLRKIQERYFKAGYLQAQAKFEDMPSKNEKTRAIRIRIDEGQRSIVDAVKISGNSAFDEKKIRKQLLTSSPGILHDGEYVPDRLDEDLTAITSLYLTKGYTEAHADKSLEWKDNKKNQKQVSVNLTIEEGVQTIVSSVNISGLKSVDIMRAFQVIQLKAGQPFRQYMVQSDENSLSSLISEKGYPHVKVIGNVTFSEDKSRADVEYAVEEGVYTTMGSIRYIGNFQTQKHILDNEVEMKPQDPFSLTKMLKTQQNLRNMEIFDSAQFKTKGLKEKAEQVDLVVEVEEKKPYYTQFGIGYDTDRNFYLKTKTGNRNLFGLNKQTWIEGEVSEIGYKGDLGLAEPRLFGSRISSNLTLFSELREEFNQDFGISSHGASLGFNRKLPEHLQLGLNFRFERRHQFLQDEEAIPEHPEDYTIRSLIAATPSITYDSRDSFIRPKKGVLSSVSVDISKGIENSLDDFIKYRFDTRAYFTPLKKLTFALRTQIGFLDPYNADNKVPTDQLFYLGGTSNIRGYDENLLRFDADNKPLGGRNSVLGSLEARLDLGMNFELTLFYDIGRVDKIDYDIETTFRSTTGFGLRYITPIGPVGFLYGIKLDPLEGESKGRFHFSMGYTF
jgi:outer membrane protein insertion porin family